MTAGRLTTALLAAAATISLVVRRGSSAETCSAGSGECPAHAFDLVPSMELIVGDDTVAAQLADALKAGGDIPTDYAFDSPSFDHFRVGISLDRLGYGGLTVRAFQAQLKHKMKSFEDHEKADAFTNLGVSLMRQERYDESHEAFKTALEINPNSDLAIDNLKVLQSYLGPELVPMRT